MAARVLHIDLTKPFEPIQTARRYRAYWAMVSLGKTPVGWVKFRRGEVGRIVTADMFHLMVGQQLGVQFADAIHRRAAEVEPPHRPGISVIICTREHPDLLRRQLNSVVALEYPEYEIIVIDNAPRTDGTQRVCEDFADRVRYIVEPRKGLDYARNAGWRAARYPIVAYTDDDARVDPHWLSALAQNYSDPRVACVTGNTFPMELEHIAQELFERYGGMQRGFQRRVFRPGPWSPGYPVGSGRFGAGVNLSLRRDVLQAMGGFDDALDVGSLARGGGDLDIMTRILRDGWNLVFEPSAIVWHQHRRTMKDLRKQMFDYGYGFTAFAAKHAQDLEYGNQVWRLLRRWWRFWGKKRLLRNFGRALRMDSNRFPVHLILIEIWGGILGYSAYQRSVQRVRWLKQQEQRNGSVSTFEPSITQGRTEVRNAA